jgi:GAF domain-containing protein
LPLERVIADATAALREATSVAGACRAALEVIGRHTNAYGAVLIRVHDRLRCVAATGSWHVYSAVQPDAGVVGRVYSTGRSEVVTNVAVDPDYISLGPLAEVEVCVPVVGEGVSIGAINLEWPNSVDTDEWRSAGEEIGRQLGAHVNWLGGPPRESRSEKLLRHAVALGTAANEDDLVTDSLIAAADVSGLHTQVIVLTQPDGLEIHIDQNAPTELAHRIAALGEDVLIPFIERAGRYGASYSHGDPDELDATGFGALTALGVRTLIAVPLGVRRDTNTIRGVLLAADETLSRPDASLVNLLELLAAQAWSSLERLQMLENLHERARSDPLTGLRHHGSFSERLAHAQPGCTAVFTIDIDGFKNIKLPWSG